MTGGHESALIRAAGLPIRLWLDAAAPEVFALVRRLEAAAADYRGAAALLAELIGAQLVPSDQLSTAERRQVLAVRRRLHHGVPLSGEDCRRLEKFTVRLGAAAAGAGGLGVGLAHAEQLAADVVLLHERAAAVIESENARLLAAPWALLRSSAAGRRMLTDPSLAPAADIAERLARGEPWTSKRMRRRSEYLWRMIARAAAKTTPRGWLGQVGLVMIDDDDGHRDRDGDLDRLTLSAAAAAEWTQNVHASRAAARSPVLAPDTWLSLAPLSSPGPGDQLRIWAVDQDTDRLRTVRLRRSAALTSVMSELRAGPMRVRDLPERAFGPAGSQQREVMHAFAGRLAGMGVLQAGAVPGHTRQSWRPIGALAAPDVGAGFLDVYRGTTGTPGVLPDLQHVIEQVQRLRALMQAEEPQAVPVDLLGPDPRPLLDVFAELLAARSEQPPAPPRHHEHGAWPKPHIAGSGYARLLDAIADQADAGAGRPDGTADITPEMLDTVGAAPARFTWPVDVILRTPGTGPWILDDTAPAGVLDARFIEMLEYLHGPVPHVTAYREFLAELDRRSGIRSVELLVPPAEEMAANAVRRPRYVSAWTGDPDPASYGFSPPPDREGPPAPADFVPLASLTVQRGGDGTQVAADGHPVRVLFHATRTSRGPWRLLADLLQDSRQRAMRTCPLRCSLAAFAGRDWLPRVTVAGSLVISAAQWRIEDRELWDPDAPELAKVRGLVRLTERRALPRWAFLSTQPGAKPLPCDLESLRALPMLEQAAGTGRPGLVIEETLPAPPWCGVPDHGCEPGDRVAAEVMIRLPAAASMASLAASLVPGGDGTEDAGNVRRPEGGEK